ncbi:hypothetical protein ACI65C_005280 [Semiaphis heraclei]
MSPTLTSKKMLIFDQKYFYNIDRVKVREFRGFCPPNRFGIRPGFAWDGVDRSNGYEQKWLLQLNSQKAVEDEAYKWSCSDM